MSKLYHCTTNGKVCLMLNGILRHIPNIEVYNRLFSIPFNTTVMIQYDSASPPVPEGIPLSPHAKLIKSDNGGHIFFVDEQGGKIVKRHITSAEHFEQLGFDWHKIETLPSDKVNQYEWGEYCIA
ncbi:MAG: hypothetical protein WAX77_12070 [Methylococcaceae bacterium]